jgi:hypothetical protein
LQKADKAKGKTAGTTLASVTALEKLIAEYEGAATAQRGRRTGAKQATKAEVQAREALAEELKAIRDDVGDALPDDLETQRAFGRGADLSTNTSKRLLDAAEGVIGAFEVHAALVRPAGVSPARIAKIQKLRAALAGADAGQRGTIGERIVATGDKKALLESIKKAVARLRRRLGTASPSGGRAPKAAVANLSARRATKKRAVKKPV